MNSPGSQIVKNEDSTSECVRRYHEGTFQRFTRLCATILMVSVAILISSGIGKTCLCGLIKQDNQLFIPSNAFNPSGVASDLKAFLSKQGCDAGPALKSKIDYASSCLGAGDEQYKVLRTGAIFTSIDTEKVKGYDWWISNPYNVNLPPAWTPSIPIAHRKLLQ